MEILGFWKKLFTKCVSVESYKLLSDKVEALSKDIVAKNESIDEMSKANVKLINEKSNLTNDNELLTKQNNTLTIIVEDKDKVIKKLTDENNLLNSKPVIEQVAANTSVIENELKVTKEKLDLTTTLLADAENEIKMLKEAASNTVDDCGCEKEEEPVLPSEDVVGDGTFEKEDVLKGADTVVTTADKLQNFINSLSKVQLKELKDDIIKGHSNDKRLTSTMKNWVKKFPDKLETQVYFMFKTALNRRRGKERLNSWYIKYDNMK